LKFKDGVDNYKPFQPKIKQKPYCLSPLNLKLSESGDYSHPYEEELKNFVPATSQVEDETILPVITNLNLVPLIYVDEESQLLSLLADICTHLIIGVDLEVKFFIYFKFQFCKSPHNIILCYSDCCIVLYIGSQYQIIPRIYLLDANINSFH
jgi:hypothetical protein